MRAPSKYDDVIDSRQIIERIDELQEDHDSLVEDVESAEEEMRDAIDNLGDLVICPTVDDWPKVFGDLTPQMDDMDLDVWRKVWSAQMAYEDLEEARKALKDEDPDEVEELRILKELQDEAEDYCPDWRYGETLVHESYFVTYAQELAEDCGMVNRDVTWPNDHIDWEAAARELRMDYTSVDFDGETYLVRMS